MVSDSCVGLLVLDIYSKTSITTAECSLLSAVCLEQLLLCQESRSEGITVEARSDSRGYYEETITDSDGKYRLRGLLPNTKYTIRAVLKMDKPGLHRIERSSPSSVSVQVTVSCSNLYLSL